jgi:hypothetical protein
MGSGRRDGVGDLKPKVDAAQESFPAEDPGPVKPCALKNEKKKPGKTWVEVALIDMLGRPVPGAQYHVLLPGESEPRIGKLDANGRVNFREIEPGTCMITFPDYDRGAWGKPSGRWPRQRVNEELERQKTAKPAAPAVGAVGGKEPVKGQATEPGAEQKAPEKTLEKTWVEFVLINMAGKPVANARYRAELPGEAAPRTGTLDANGKVAFYKIDPGTCTICFPDYDKDAWLRVEAV